MTVSAATPPLEYDSPKTVLNALRGRGMRVSTARRVIVHTLFAAEGAVSAEQIAEGLGGRSTQLDLASVYRNLETLEKLGVVRHFHAGHGPGRYALTGGHEREYLACESCGAVVEVEPRELDEARAAVRQRFGFEVAFSHFPIVGRCPRCTGGEG